MSVVRSGAGGDEVFFGTLGKTFFGALFDDFIGDFAGAIVLFGIPGGFFSIINAISVVSSN